MSATASQISTLPLVCGIIAFAASLIATALLYLDPGIHAPGTIAISNHAILGFGSVAIMLVAMPGGLVGGWV